MTLTVRQKFALQPATSTVGAFVDGIDLREELDDEAIVLLAAELHRWKVLFFRNQRITAEQQIAFGRRFGALTPAHPIHRADDEHPELFVVDTQKAKAQFGYSPERPPFAPPRKTEAGWHTDITFVANPASASILRAAVVPPFGGDTLWTNLAAAYEDLSERVRDLVDNLQAVHVWHGYDGEVRPGYDPSQKPPAAVHPVVRVHPVTGVRSLFVNPVFTRYIVGVTDRENRHLLDLLFEQIARPEFTVRFHWEPDSIAFWDNRSTAHLGPVDLASSDFDRRVERVTIAGEIPVGPDGFMSVPLQGESLF